MFRRFQAKIIVNRAGRIRVTGDLRRYSARVRDFLEDLEITRIKILYRDGRYEFAGRVSPEQQQRIRNFLVNQCPIPKQ